MRIDLFHKKEDEARQDALNKELDGALNEAVFNCDITMDTDESKIRGILEAWIGHEVSDEQWLLFGTYCLQRSQELRAEMEKIERAN